MLLNSWRTIDGAHAGTVDELIGRRRHVLLEDGLRAGGWIHDEVQIALNGIVLEVPDGLSRARDDPVNVFARVHERWRGRQRIVDGVVAVMPAPLRNARRDR